MSSVIGIICEYNPFHKGHKYQIDTIRQIHPNATIVAIMSGNIVQRGEFAIIDKYDRAKIALECGVNAVFELPYPYSGSTAEIFARAGVKIADGLGCDYLYFGTEEENIESLEKIASAVDSKEFEAQISIALKDKSTGYILAKENTLESMGYKLPKNANDMLAIEYIRAINKSYPRLKYGTVKRIGSFYNDLSKNEIMSASGIRQAFYEKEEFVSVPQETMALYEEIIREKRYLNTEQAKSVVRILGCSKLEKNRKIFDTNSDIKSIIKKAHKISENGDAFVSMLTSKTYTQARIKRSLMYTIFEIDELAFVPGFTVLLAADDRGKKVISKARKENNIGVITKHADCKNLYGFNQKLLEKLYKVDELYGLLLMNPKAPEQAYKRKPIIK